MSANGNGQFLENELIHRKVKVGNEWQTRTFPVVGGRLRLAHEENQNLNLQTEMVSWDGQYAIFKCSAVTGKGQFVGYGTANSQRDAKLAESLIELAETRSVARALRFAGFGLEFTSAEEVSHVGAAEPDREQTGSKAPAQVFQGDNGRDKSEKSKPQSDGIDPTTTGETRAPSGTTAETGSKPQRCGIGQATQAQCRALYALTKRAHYTDQDVKSLLSPLNASTFQELSRQSASQLITYMQTEVAA